MVAHAEGSTLLVGFNRGEWCGGLVRVELSTGRAETVELPTLAERAACNVNGLVASPGKPGCFMAAVGVVHLRADGRLVEVCPSEVTIRLSRPYTSGAPALHDSGTVAFFGLARAGETLIASGHDGLYRVTGEDVERLDYPAFEDVGGVRVSFDVPGFALVLTSINQRHSLSGAVPLLVPMQ